MQVLLCVLLPVNRTSGSVANQSSTVSVLTACANQSETVATADLHSTDGCSATIENSCESLSLASSDLQIAGGSGKIYGPDRQKKNSSLSVPNISCASSTLVSATNVPKTDKVCIYRRKRPGTIMGVNQVFTEYRDGSLLFIDCFGKLLTDKDVSFIKKLSLSTVKSMTNELNSADFDVLKKTTYVG